MSDNKKNIANKRDRKHSWKHPWDNGAINSDTNEP